MGFLDNSGDIILDAVLTDAGRARLAKGDGSFRVTKFALGDDEINYKLYDLNHPGGTAYYSNIIMQTPVFESFTNNIASLNSRLISISKTNHLYLPVIKINNLAIVNNFANEKIVKGGYVLLVDKMTEDMFSSKTLAYDENTNVVGTSGIIKGFSQEASSVIKLDQGIDNVAINLNTKLDSDLRETQYLVEIDNRLASIINPLDLKMNLQPSYVDDDDIAGYFFALDDSSKLVSNNTSVAIYGNGQVIRGPRGTTINFSLKASLETSTSQFLFDQLGTDVTSLFTNNGSPAGNNIKSIITTVRITGLTTGYAVDVPLVLVKKIS